MSLVRTALYSNALFSACTGLLAALRPELVARWLGSTAPDRVRVVGVLLLGFAGWVSAVGRPRSVKPLPVLLISAVDAAWVVCTPPLLLLLPDQFSATGHALMVAVAAVVAACSIGQLGGLGLQYANPDRDSLFTHRVCLEVPAEAPAEALWRVISDLGAIDQHSPNLRSSKLVQGNAPGVGAARRCVDQQGRGWTEVCTAWEPGRAFSLRFDSDAPDFPFPFRALVGGWAVAERGAGANVRIWWEMVPQARFGGGLLVAIMAAGLGRSMSQLVATMAAAAVAKPGTTAAHTSRRFGAIVC